MRNSFSLLQRCQVTMAHRSERHRKIVFYHASQTGVDALKLQTFTPESMTLNLDHEHFKVTNKKSLWYGRRLYDLYEEVRQKEPMA